VEVLFYQERGLSFTQIMTLAAIHYIVTALTEIPTGVVADRWGRKYSLIIGSFGVSIASFILALSYSFSVFAIGFLCWAVSASFISGADSALLYDSLLTLKREQDYHTLEGKATSIALITTSVGDICGGLLANIGLVIPVLATGIIVLISGVIAATFKEPNIHHAVPKSEIRYWAHIRESALLVFSRFPLRWLFIYSALLFVLSRSMFYTYQPYLKSIAINVTYFGLIYASFNVIAALFSRYSSTIEKKLGEYKMLMTLPLLYIGTFTFLYWLIKYPWGLTFLYLAQIARGLSEPVLRTYINNHTPSRARATVLSLRSFSGRIVFFVLAPLLGASIDRLSLGSTYLICAVTTCASFLLIFLRKRFPVSISPEDF
jgi:MFS family permease